MIESYTDSVQRYEAVFTKQFEDKGFKWDVYVKTDDLKDFTDYPLLVCPTLLLREKKCPLFKRRSFMHSWKPTSTTRQVSRCRSWHDYSRDETDYPMDLIWKNMIRTMHPHDFYPQSRADPHHRADGVGRRNGRGDPHQPPHCAGHAPVFYGYAGPARRLRPKFPPETDVFISTSSADKKPQIEKAFADLNVAQRHRDRGGEPGPRRRRRSLCDLAPQLRDYDYACFMHDKKPSDPPGSVGASFGYVCNENVCKNAAHVLNVLCEFEKDPYLGILCPPFPTHGLYFMNMCSGGWGPNFENTKKLMKDLGIDAPVSGEKIAHCALRQCVLVPPQGTGTAV